VTAAPVRCAIYTRKSTDENLDSDFNSLDAQRESAEAYIHAQRGEGWVALPDRYDDGAYSGATIDRPALQRLMADVRAGRVNTIVVYKIDRLSRSLLDFTKLVEELERHEVSLVAVTQQFNTTTSMGRLTLNILLSFAQYERELITERISDKMAAARKKGKYVGGIPAFGYDVDRVNKRLVVNQEEAVIVRYIFRRFLQVQGAVDLVSELSRKGYRTKAWVSKKGKERPGKPWHKNHLYRLLRNPVYIGKVEYKGEVYNGEHEPIIDMDLWNQVQAAIASPPKERSNQNRAETPGLLKGMLRCGYCGTSMAVAFTKRNGRLYRYYNCHRATRTGYHNCAVRSISAGIVEDLVKNLLRRVFRSPEVVERTLEAVRRIQTAEQGQLEGEKRRLAEELAGVRTCGEQLMQSLRTGENAFVRGELDRLDRRRAQLEADLQAAQERLEIAGQTPQATEDLARELATLDNIWDNLFPGEQQHLVRTVIERVTLHTDRFEITLRADGVQHVVDLLVGNDGAEPGPRTKVDPYGKTTISIPILLKRRGGRKEIVLAEEAQRANTVFLLTLARAFRWKDLLESGRFPTIKALAEAVGHERSYVAKMLNLALLSPSIVAAVVAGKEPDGLLVAKLRQGVPVCWEEQHRIFPGT
jgi:site-specific DNA recombinase